MLLKHSCYLVVNYSSPAHPTLQRAMVSATVARDMLVIVNVFIIIIY